VSFCPTRSLIPAVPTFTPTHAHSHLATLLGVFFCSPVRGCLGGNALEMLRFNTACVIQPRAPRKWRCHRDPPQTSTTSFDHKLRLPPASTTANLSAINVLTFQGANLHSDAQCEIRFCFFFFLFFSVV
jgi:hypothetical protein